MNPLETLLFSLKKAMRAQNREWARQISEQPGYLDLSGVDLDYILHETASFFQDVDLVRQFATHPNFIHSSSDTVGLLLMAAFRMDVTDVIDPLIHFPQMQTMSSKMMDSLAIEALRFQSDRFIAYLALIPNFQEAFDRHLDEMILCAIRNRNQKWMRELFNHPSYDQVDPYVFPDLIHWALQQKDSSFIQLILQKHHFDPQSEDILQIELLDVEAEEKEEIEAEIIETLIYEHLDYPHFSSNMIGWLMQQAIQLENKELLNHLTEHQQYLHLSRDRIADLMIQALNHQTILESLTQHPQFQLISGEKLGLILEEATRVNFSDLIESLIHHPAFDQIPEDSFRRLLLTKIQSSSTKFSFLTSPIFKQKYEKVIEEMIRRNETEIIDQLYANSDLKHLVIHQLMKYALSDNMFVNLYVIRDMIREAIISHDEELIQEIQSAPLFSRHLIELMQQAVQYDDEKLIESFLVSPLLKNDFKKFMQTVSASDKKRLFQLFTSQSSFKEKASHIIKEIQKWKE
jgi:hypothetical protein